jgi:hypothetical protein
MLDKKTIYIIAENEGMLLTKDAIDNMMRYQLSIIDCLYHAKKEGLFFIDSDFVTKFILFKCTLILTAGDMLAFRKETPSLSEKTYPTLNNIRQQLLTNSQVMEREKLINDVGEKEFETFYRERMENEHKKWAGADDEQLKKLWYANKFQILKIARIMGRTPASIEYRLKMIEKVQN